MDEKEANNLLENSRRKIDEFDNQILELILERTALAKDIVTAKKVLKKDLFDASREEIIRNKVINAVADKEINTDKVVEVFELLAAISKEEQKKYL
ncbi:MAG: chorismate mutase [Methanosphaera sp.]|nr:chorismate mutase [Methanosphaera sp.]